MTSIQPTPTDCPFCERIKRGEVDFFYMMEAVVGFEPLNPVTKGHLLFVPRKHVVDAAEDPAITANVFGAAADYAKEKLSKLQSFNLITSAGKYATQTVEHLHVHLVPRRKDDGLTLPWTGQKKEQS